MFVLSVRCAGSLYGHCEVIADPCNGTHPTWLMAGSLPCYKVKSLKQYCCAYSACAYCQRQRDSSLPCGQIL